MRCIVGLDDGLDDIPRFLTREVHEPAASEQFRYALLLVNEALHGRRYHLREAVHQACERAGLGIAARLVEAQTSW